MNTGEQFNPLFGSFTLHVGPCLVNDQFVRIASSERSLWNLKNLCRSWRWAFLLLAIGTHWHTGIPLQTLAYSYPANVNVIFIAIFIIIVIAIIIVIVIVIIMITGMYGFF